MKPGITIDQHAVQAELDQLASYSDSPAPAVTRVLWSDADLRARTYIKNLCSAATLELREDAVGNLFARWPGSDPTLPPVASGSHIDAIPNSGRYDGTVGILGAIEAVRALKRAGFQPRRTIEIVMFTAEQPTRFGISCLGSRALAGLLGAQDLAALRDADGQDFETLRLAAGLGEHDVNTVQLPTETYANFVELHIEQGTQLEASGTPVGIVRTIAAPGSLRVQLQGRGGHAGTVLMPDRHDALLAGAGIALAVEHAALSSGSVDTVATTGVFQVTPGVVNSIPGKVLLEIDVRDTRLEPRNRTMEAIQTAITEICTRRGVLWDVTVLNADPPATCDPLLISVVEQSCQALGVPYRHLISRAYHDTLFMSHICPVTMIFVPCQGGVSHHPDEYAAPEDIARGIEILAHTLARLAE